MSGLKVEIDGKIIEVQHGSMVMEAATKLGIYVPHFCYHKKLSIAANCRMCLVEVEKAPKPMPACATPVTDGMKVWTHSPKAKQAQNGVMEFLLINHPLDCPICDQGGECQLQDIAVGYGGSSSRYAEAKRVVGSKDIGPLVAAEEMSRCIQCTRCVRFGQEIAGVMELGMIGRGEHSEIVSFVGKAVDSELSGNMIDICPVGALTSRPFRYGARTWELQRRRSVSPHDGLGANLIVQTKGGRVLRVVPFENEEINECWLADRDRFSYEGLNSPDRLAKPMIRQGGDLREVDWQTALEHVARRLDEIKTAHGADSIGALVSPHSTLEEMSLLARLVRGLGGDNVDFRLRQSDFSADGKRAGAPWLGLKISEIAELDRSLLVGTFLRKDHPLLASRFRAAAKRRQQVNLLTLTDDELLVSIANKAVVRPAEMPAALAAIVRATAEAKGVAVPAGLETVAVTDAARAIAASLASGSKVGIFLGNAAEQHPQAATLQALAQELARILGGTAGVLGAAANSVGGYIAGCVPASGGLNARAMLETPRKAYLLLNCEPELDCEDPSVAMNALGAAEFVVAFSPWSHRAAEYADVILPISPHTETSGSFVNAEGRMQSFNGVVPPFGDSRPGWKVLRVIGNLLSLTGFDQETSEAVRDQACEADAVDSRLGNGLQSVSIVPRPVSVPALERVTDVPVYFSDSLVRRAASLQRTADAAVPCMRINPALAARLGFAAGSRARVRQGGAEAVLEVSLDAGVPEGCVRIAAAHQSTATLGPMFGELSVERA